MKSKNHQDQKQSIKEVYEDNFIYEIKRLGSYLKEYPYIGMDTEFPGSVYPLNAYSKDFYYQYIKVNVDKLKLIQFGVTLCNEKGETAPDGSTWQFNLRFNLEKDIHAKDSITMLSNCGIDFNLMKHKGIHHHTFAEYFLVSGLALNEDVKWISFNGLSDFAYLLRLCLNSNLPETPNEFMKLVGIYFPEVYDIKILANQNDNLKGGLNKIAQQLSVERIGEIHQAGSDSIVTAEVFFQMGYMNLISKEEIAMKKNILYGIGEGADDYETYQYTLFANNNGMNGMNGINGMNGMNGIGLKANDNMMINNAVNYQGYFNGSGLSNGNFDHNGFSNNKKYPLGFLMPYGN